MSELGLARKRPRQSCLNVDRKHDPDDQAMLAALRVVLGLPKQLPGNGRHDLLLGSQLSNRYTPDRTDHDFTEELDKEDAE